MNIANLSDIVNQSIQKHNGTCIGSVHLHMRRHFGKDYLRIR